MTNRETAQLKAGDRAESFMTANDTALTGITLYAPHKLAFDTAIAAIRAAKLAQAEDTTVFASDKAGLKAAMAKTINTFAMRALVQAHDLGKPELELGLTKSPSYITHSDDSLAIDRATELKKLMKDNIATLTEVKAADILAMEAAITAFTDIANRPVSEIKSKKAIATDPIPGLISKLMEEIYYIGNLVHSYLQNLAHTWDIETKVGASAGVRHTSLALHITDAVTGVHLKNVKCTITDGTETKIKKSTKLGWVRAYSLESGNWNITSELANYTTDVQTDVGIDENHIARIEIKLKKIPLNKNGQPQPDPETTTGMFDLYSYDKSTNLALPGAENSIPQLNHVNTTDEDAEDYLDMIPPGTYTGTLSMDGYNPLPYTFTIAAGQTTTLQLYLIAATP